MSNRAERRRKERAEEKSRTKKYTFTKDQLDGVIREAFSERLNTMKREATDDAINQALVLTLALPMEVLIHEYWPKSYSKKIPGFVNSVLALYQKWQDGEVEIEDLQKDLWEYGGVKFEETEVEESEK